MINPLVSIIIPVYNVENYLEECINSVLSQTYDNIEFIIINDGSSDSSAGIISRFAEKDERIIFIDNINCGVGASRNIGLKKASGDYTLFIDSDDYVDKCLVETLLKSIESDDICMYDALAFEDSTRRFSSHKYFKGLSNELLQQQIKDKTYKAYLFFYISPCLKLYKTSFLKEYQIYFPEGTYGEDVPFWLHCYMLTDKIKYIEYIGYYRRYRSLSIMTTGSAKNLKDRVDNISELFSATGEDRGLQIKILIYALDCWFSAYDLKDKSLLQLVKTVYESDAFSLKNKIKELHPPVDLRLRYTLCRYSNRCIINIYKFLFYKVYTRIKKL